MSRKALADEVRLTGDVVCPVTLAFVPEWRGTRNLATAPS